MELALSFALHSRLTILQFCALGCGITSPANDLAASGGQGETIGNLNTPAVLEYRVKTKKAKEQSKVKLASS